MSILMALAAPLAHWASPPGGLVNSIIYLVVLLAVLGLLWWLVGYVASKFSFPPVVATVAQVIIVIAAVIIAIKVLLGLAGAGGAL